MTGYCESVKTFARSFFLSDRKVLNIFLVGTGLIGKSLLSMIDKQFQQLASQNHLEVNVVGIANSKKMHFNANGLLLENAVDQMKESGEVMGMNDFFGNMIGLNLSNSILSIVLQWRMAEYYASILSSNISIVTPTKKRIPARLVGIKNYDQSLLNEEWNFCMKPTWEQGYRDQYHEWFAAQRWSVIRIEAVLSGTLILSSVLLPRQEF